LPVAVKLTALMRPADKPVALSVTFTSCSLRLMSFAREPATGQAVLSMSMPLK
jgi:hypothetical protein